MRRALAVAVVLLAHAAPAEARDPGRWVLTGWSSVPSVYWQGVTGDRAGRLYFDGIFEGLYRTNSRLRQRAGIPDAVPATAEGFDHIGDITLDRDRLVLPLECYDRSTGANTCGVGAFGVADPDTLAWRYHVSLDPAEIQKAMWAEVSPDGRLIWTSGGGDLLAYRARDVRPGAGPLRAVARAAYPSIPTGITGAAFRGRRLFLASQSGGFRVWSVPPGTRARPRPEIDLGTRISGEAEGLHAGRLLGGDLHWLIAPLPTAGRPLTFGPTSALLHFTRVSGQPRLKVAVRARAAVAGRRTRMSVKVTHRGRPVRAARVVFGGRADRTDRFGRATITQLFGRAGKFGVLATKDGLRGMSKLVAVRGGD